MAIASLVLGCFSLVFSLAGFFTLALTLGICNILGLILGIIGLVLGIIAKKKEKPSGMITAGIVTSIIGIVLSVLSLVACVSCVGCTILLS